MLSIFKNIIVCSLLLVILQGCNKKTGLPDLKERYQYKDTRPFGAYTAYSLLGEIYPDKFIGLTSKPFAKFYADTHIDSFSFYISISNKYYASEKDAQSLVEFVSEGNTAFIAASVIDSSLLGKVFTRQARFQWMTELMGERYVKAKLYLLPDELSKQDTFSYYYIPFSNYFSEIDANMGRIVGYNGNNQPNCVVFFIGKGRLYLHCDPRAFSNYFLLTANNYNYMKQLMQLMNEKPGNIFWDDYYNKINYKEDNGKSSSAISYLLKHPALAIAFWIVLAMLLGYIFFNGKRKQRIIPVIKPVKNTSVAFTEAIAGLYLAEQNNKNMAEKMITHFNEYIRSRYFLNVHSVNTDFIAALSKKSGVQPEAVQALYNAILQIQVSEELSDFELLALNEQIQEFYKKRN